LLKELEMDENKVGERIKNRVDNGRDLRAAIRTQGSAVAEQLDGVGGRSEADWKAHLDGIATDQQKYDEHLMHSELQLASERGDDGKLRDGRDEATGALSDKVLEVKEFMKDVPTQERFALDGRTPDEPKNLVAYARGAVFALRKQNVALPGPLGTSLGSHEIADEVEPLMVAVEAAIERMKTEGREADQLLVRRNASLDKWQEVYVANARMAEGAFRRAGFVSLAERIRPTERKSRGVEGPAVDAPKGDEKVEEEVEA
jgi:hypothetical protein